MEVALFVGPGKEEGPAEAFAARPDPSRKRKRLRALTLASVPAAHTRRAYGKALDDLFRLAAAGR